jgi:hypothetical protein
MGTVLPSFPPTVEDLKNLGELKHMLITMFVGKTDPPWRD